MYRELCAPNAMISQVVDWASCLRCAGKGSTFTVRLPVNPSTPKVSSDMSRADGQGSSGAAGSPRATLEASATQQGLAAALRTFVHASQPFFDLSTVPRRFSLYLVQRFLKSANITPKKIKILLLHSIATLSFEVCSIAKSFQNCCSDCAPSWLRMDFNIRPMAMCRATCHSNFQYKAAALPSALRPFAVKGSASHLTPLHQWSLESQCLETSPACLLFMDPVCK